MKSHKRVLTKAVGVMKKLFFLFGLLPAAVHAEVMDKEASLLMVWSTALVIALLCFGAARFRPWLLLLAVPVAAILAAGQLSEVTDPYVGPVILQEAGSVYVTSSWAAPFVAFLGVVAGLWFRRRHHVDQKGAAADVP